MTGAGSGTVGSRRQEFGGHFGGRATTIRTRLSFEAMIPALSRADDYKRRPPLFVSNRSLRPLRVMVDAEVVDDVDLDRWAPETVLAGLLTHESIELFRYADDGPPPSAPVKNHDWVGPTWVGWVVAEPIEPPVRFVK